MALGKEIAIRFVNGVGWRGWLEELHDLSHKHSVDEWDVVQEPGTFRKRLDLRQSGKDAAMPEKYSAANAKDLQEPQVSDKMTFYDGLRTPDQRTLRFTPLGLATAHIMRPESSADYLRRLVGLPIAGAVPQEIQQVLLRLRSVFHHGLFDYELFTAAGDLAYLAVEGASRRRFILAYDGRVPFVKNDQHEAIAVADFDDVHKAIRRGAYARKEGWRLAGIATGVHPEFDASFTGLLQWARREKLLSGQRNRAIEIVNRLWGATTEGGRLYPGPLRREPVVLARSPDASSQESFHPSLLPQDVDERGDWETVILLAVPHEELWNHHLGFETTFHSTRLLWGPGPMTDALDAWRREGESWTGDTVEVLDRVFFVRYPPGVDTPELPRSRETATVLPEEEQLGRWLVIVADTPFAALAHARRHVIGQGAMQRGWCDQCQTTSFGVHKTLAEALDIDTNGADHA